jgi:amidophosphoribosyltransferase
MRNLNEKCAVIAISNAQDFDVARLAYLGLWSMQHRGQDSSGIASHDGIKLHLHKKTGLVSQVYNDASLGSLKGKVAIGHNRYATAGGNSPLLNQPYENEGLGFAFAHNGNLPFTEKLEKYADDNQLFNPGLNDSGLMALVLSNELKKSGSIEAAVRACWPLFTGAFSCVGLYKDKAFAFRDQHGIRPLSLGKSDQGYVVASESVALEIIGADLVRDVNPGELVIIQENKLESVQITEGNLRIDAFEFVYLARPDSVIAGRSVYSARYRAGEALAKLAPVKADVVFGVPDSGMSAAAGFAKTSGISHEPGLLKNRYIGRTFIEPEKIRKDTVQLKFNVIKDVVADKNIVLIDDSLVRGNTLNFVIKQLKKYGAKSVHVRIASPPVKFPDFYGIDTPNGQDLIANEYNESQIGDVIRADSLAFLPIQELVRSIGLTRSQLNLSSFDGNYPIAVPHSSITS